MKLFFQKHFPIKIILKVYTFGLIIFFLFRLLLLLTISKHLLQDNSLKTFDLLRSMYYGSFFDIMVTSHLVFFPYLLLVFSFYLKRFKLFFKISFWFTFIMFSLAFIISGADIPYFNNFFLRFNVNAFEWLNTPVIVIKMILFERRFSYIIIPVVFVLWGFYKILKKIFSNKPTHYNPLQKQSVTYFAIFGLFILIGLKSNNNNTPIVLYESFENKNTFLKYLMLNPVYSLSKSVENRIEEKIQPSVLLNKSTAIRNMQYYLDIKEQKYKSPIARKIIPDSVTNNKKNVVLILMESMACYRMKRFGNKDNLTPFLDSLYANSLSFSNLYSAGMHTYNGVYSSLTSYPALYETHPMKEKMDISYNNMAFILKKLGYSTSFFIPHDKEFDNLQSFLSKNSFDQIYSIDNYPKEKSIGIYGVPDDYLFNFAIDNFNKKTNKPFFATILTVSNHSPYVFPEYYKDKEEDNRKKGVKYADWAIKNFMKKAKKQSWYKNTIFVFVADHGKVYSMDYDMPLNYHHIPLIIYHEDIHPKEIDKIGGQIDLFPTVMGILNLPYVNNTFGIDLQKQSRPYILFNKDDKYGVLSQNYFLITQKNRIIGLYKYKKKNLINYAKIMEDTLQEMNIYYKSHIETTQYIFKNNYQYLRL